MYNGNMRADDYLQMNMIIRQLDIVNVHRHAIYTTAMCTYICVCGIDNRSLKELTPHYITVGCCRGNALLMRSKVQR